ncbi:hypothetical protein SLEP1_g6540 [Rubroshorea leprosula]|uniref:Uncharacterized protein n=1 Tax=Rubroshorea leprosula TaxID=152421 RepID=A0AAV5HVJ6_9ROSI|nr:hypothetical protein SLEP1_g6540 [Rubroshorea leprosula]
MISSCWFYVLIPSHAWSGNQIQDIVLCLIYDLLQ